MKGQDVGHVPFEEVLTGIGPVLAFRLFAVHIIES